MTSKKLLKALGVFTAMFFLSLSAFSQSKVVTGKVTDAKDGSPLSGVTVSPKGLPTGTQTGEDGAYSISVTTSVTTLVFSNVGYETKEVSIVDRTNVDISMDVTASSLGEVVVIGYGTARKRDLTGSITTISSKDFVKGAITTPEQLIAGKVAGVQITSNGGAPGAGSTIRIRGGASLNASNDPLIVIDGVPLDNGGISGAANPLALINPNDIETFNVMKDASAAAIYGSRASNGVIIITTKKGRGGKPRVNFNTQVSSAQIARKVDVMTAAEHRAYVTAYAAENGTPNLIDSLGTASTDWQDQIYRNAISTDNNISISGSTKNMPYRFSVGYLNQNGILKTGNLERISAGVNLSPKFFDNHLSIDLNIKGSVSNSRFANEGAIGAAVIFDPSKPVYSNDKQSYGGYFEFLNPSTVTGLRDLTPRNPLGMLEQQHNNGQALRSIGNVVVDYKFHFLPELRANLNLGYDASYGHGTNVVDDKAAMGYKRFLDNTTNTYHGGTRNRYSQYKNNYTAEFYLNYVKDITGINSRVDVTAGSGYYDFQTIGVASPDHTYDGTIVTRPQFIINKPQYTLLSYYGRLNYTFNNKYLLTAAIRTDGSSRFSKANRWGVFPALAFAWRIKEEGFLRNSNVVSDLKLRLGYGVTGQQDGIGYFDYISYYNLSNQTAQYQLGDQWFHLYRPGGYYENRKWEQTATYNAALDFGFLNNRITGTVDFYLRKTTDLLNEIDQPAGTNFSNKIVANVGSMENRGVEFNISADVIRGTDFNWSVNFNATYNRNEITKLTISDDPEFLGNRYGGISGGTGQTLFVHTVNYRRGSFFMYKQVYDKETNQPIDGLFEDVNRDGVINEKDLYQYKGPDPEAFFGFSTNLSYKKWNAGFVMRANVGNYIYNNVNSNIGIRSIVFGNGFLGNGYSDLMNTHISGRRAGFSLSDYYIQNGSFLRMDNINLGYDIGSVFNKKATLRLNANVQNVFVITKYKGLDPEMASGVDNNFYPRPRTFVIGANLDF